MSWPINLSLSPAAYPLSVVQRTVYHLAESVAVQVAVEPDCISLQVFPAHANLTLPEGQARALVLQHLNDFALRDQIDRETAGLREALVRAALTGCELTH
ncbi:His-Xaa-Ser system protein HxsD [Pseudomonas sp. SWRI107]|uniref:His-Xaa-Ser system protein HxsD n=1 Tax=Pseudomonas farsensis TaxID=2745492 RepID=UPI001647744C|nr:His-Xaa-Ser system protein HxsD [Pseudomonas farsensis]MBV4531261.1 His-Xaa-Ser system protein HxsD [Pseudomonas farsensis]